MIRITDITLSCLAAFHPSPEQISRLYGLLVHIGSDAIEMPVSAYKAIQPTSSAKIVLRISSPLEIDDYPEINRFVIRQNGFEVSNNIMTELQINDIKELTFLGQNNVHKKVRLTGLDDVICHDYEKAFSKILKNLKGCRVEFCPENSVSCATAAAVEWLAAGGTDIAASFGGIGNKAALEEVLLALRVVRRYKPSATYDVFPEIAAVLEEIVSQCFDDRKAVIGRGIFEVESGIHVDGIMKKSKMYEPFLPELVGRSRKFVTGKHSGRKSISAKLSEMGLPPENFDIQKILGAVRKESIRKQTSLTDEEFIQIAQHYRL